MRDPDLTVRAQRAATALESAWCHWRNMHGLTTDPAPPVSSYVGYSLDAPWGEARIVFGICAEEAEQLAGLLERHDCVGPVHASVTARSVDRAGSAPLDGAAGQPGAAGLLRVPAPAPASAGQQPLAASAVGSRYSDLLAPRNRGPVRDLDGDSPLTAPMPPAGADVETPIARAVSRAFKELLASKRAPAATSSADADQPDESAPTQAGQPDQSGPVQPGQPGQPAPAQAAQPDQSAPTQAGESGQPSQSAPMRPGQPGQPAPTRAGQTQSGRPRQPGQPAPTRVGQPGPAQPGRPGQPGQAAATRAGKPSRETRSAVGPEQRGGQDDRPGREVTEVFDAIEPPGVVAFRLKHRATVAGFAGLAPAPSAAPSGTDDTGPTPAPGPSATGRPADGRDGAASTAANEDAATWAASNVPGQAVASDPGV